MSRADVSGRSRVAGILRRSAQATGAGGAGGRDLATAAASKGTQVGIPDIKTDAMFPGVRCA